MTDTSRDSGTALLSRTVCVTVSGSFSRHLVAIRGAVEHFQALGVQVLSPEDPRIVDAVGSFVFLASDRHRSIRLTEDRHLDAIRHSDFLWVVCPDGYIGPSTSLEIGFAIARGVPVLSDRMPDDFTHRQYVDVVATVEEAICRPSRRGSGPMSTSLLVDPAMAGRGHIALDELAASLSISKQPASEVEAVYAASRTLLRSLVP